MFFRSLGQSQNNLTLRDVVLNSIDKEKLFFYPTNIAELGVAQLNSLVEFNQKEVCNFLLNYFETQLTKESVNNIIENVFQDQSSQIKLIEKTSSSVFLSLSDNYHENYASLPVNLTVELFQHYTNLREYSYKKNLFICTTNGAEGMEVIKKASKYKKSDFIIILPSHANPIYEKYFLSKAKENENLTVVKINANIDRCRNIEKALLVSKLTKFRNVCSLSGFNFSYIIGCMMQIVLTLHQLKFSEVNFSLPFIEGQYAVAISLLKKMGFNINGLCYSVNNVACIERAMMNGHLFMKADTIYDTKYNMLNQYPVCLEYLMQEIFPSKEYLINFNNTFLYNENAFLAKQVYDKFHTNFQLFRLTNEEINASVSTMIKKFSRIFDPLTVLGYTLTQYNNNENLNLKNGLPVMFMEFESHMFFSSYLKEVLTFNIDIDPELQKQTQHELKSFWCEDSIELMNLIQEKINHVK